MSEHIWSQEQIASYLTGGLAADERERLDRHAKECPECAAALAAAIHFDRGLGTLFAPLRPKPGLEDRAVQATRLAPKRHAILILGWPRRITAAAAAIIFLGTFGALGASFLADGKIPMPGQGLRMEARGSLEPEALKHIQVANGIPNDDLALGYSLETLADDTRRSILQSGEGKAEDPTSNFDRPARGHSLAREHYAQNPQNRQNEKGWQENSANPDGYRRGYNTNGNVPPTLGYGNGIGGGFNGGGGFNNGVLTVNPNTAPSKDSRPDLFSFYSGTYGVPLPMGMGQPGQQNPGPAPAPVVPTVGPAGTGGGPQMGDKSGDAGPTTAKYFKPGESSLRLTTEGENKGKSSDNATKNLDDFVKGDNKEGIKDLAQNPKPADPKAPPGTSNGFPITGADPVNPAVPEPTRRVVLRSGDIEFELESFDSGLATVTQLVTKIKGAFVGTVNSEKLANGKVRGSITVRTPPEFLDALVLDLRKELGKGGEIKSVKLVSQDVTKQFTDTESRLKAARAMETRLLKMIQDGKGEIKQLLEAERELGVWRTKIEESEGELRYYASHAALSTLTITLQEKEIRAAVGVTENERVQAGVEVEDVDKTYQQVLKEIVDAKGRVLKSELKQLAAGQFNAMLNFEVSPDASGPIRDRLRQIGRVARLEIDRQQQAEGGTMPKNAPVKRGDTLFMVQLYNLANIAPREIATLSVAVADVPNSYNAIRDAIAKAAGRVQVAQLNENDKTNVTAQLDFDIKRTDEGAIRAALAAAGDVSSRTVTRAAESDQVTDTKIQYRVSLSSVARLRPRVAFTMQIAANDVTTAYNALREAVATAKGRVLTSNLDQNNQQNLSASLDFEVRRADEAAVKALVEASGETVSRQVVHAPENEASTDTKVLYSIRLMPAKNLRPRDAFSVQIAVNDVPASYTTIRDAVLAAKGRILASNLDENDKQNVNASLDFEIAKPQEAAVKGPLDAAGELLSRNVAHAAENEAATDSKVLYSVRLLPANRLRPRETTVLGLEVADVDNAVAVFTANLNEVKGRQIESKSGRERNGKATARLVYEVPLATAPGLVERFKGAGTVRALNSQRDTTAPEGKSATARIEITLGNSESVVGPDDGVWPPVKKGLSYSFSVLLTSLTWVVFGLCVVLPWALVGYGGYRVVKRVTRPASAEIPVVPPAPPAPQDGSAS